MIVVKEKCPWCGKGILVVVSSAKAVRKKCIAKGCAYSAWLPKEQLTEDEKKRYRVYGAKREESNKNLLHPPQASAIVLHGVKQYLATQPLPEKHRLSNYLR